MTMSITSAPQAVAPIESERSASAEHARQIVEQVFAGIDAGVAVVLADGTCLYQEDEIPRATIVLRNADVLKALLARSSDAIAGEAVMRGDIDVHGDLEQVFIAMDKVAAVRTARDWMRIAASAVRLPRASGGSAQLRPAPGLRQASLRGRLHSRERDRAAIAYHYDVSNEFYALWLDQNLTYSCAYFKTDQDTLDQAQLQKYDLICRKLRLQSGERLLDVGCGWGGLVRFAAREYGARAVGITLSARQADEARRRIDAEGLSRLCTIELQDYRDIERLGTFDKAASVGMVEHVGDSMLAVYFQSVFKALKPGGLFVNHGIVTHTPVATGLHKVSRRFFPARSRFIEKYVFPDGELPRLAAMSELALDTGFEVRDVENLREHYAKTLRHWVRRLEKAQAQARLLVGDSTYNVWRFYMAGSAHGFAVSRMGVVQMLLAKPDAQGRAHLPLTRQDIYR